MKDETRAFQPETRVLDKFIAWLEGFPNQHARDWAKRYHADEQAATCEAMCWGVLTDCGVEVEPHPDLTGPPKTPDFICRKGKAKFYVEVTCIRIETATKHTGLEHDCPSRRGTPFRPLNDLIFKEAISKTPQCANLDAPCLLAVGTFHYCASVLCINRHSIKSLLSGETRITWPLYSSGCGSPDETFLSTEFRSAAFLKPNPWVGFEAGRQPISALLVAGFGVSPPVVLGAIHPYPVRKFDTNLLDRIPFCKAKIDNQDKLITCEWTHDESEAAREC